MIRRWRWAPAVHFLCLGACLLALEPRGTDAPGRATVSDEELLYQAALDAGIDRTDRAVAGRLARLGSFVGEDAGDEAALEAEAEARRLGLARSDVVVRRHLAQMMELAAGRLRPEDVPTAAELAARAAELTLPARVRFTHVYVSRARHGDPTTAASRLLGRLRGEGIPPEAARSLGDPFVTGNDVAPSTDAELDRRFGAGFAAALATVPEAAWSDPIASTYGLHLVWVRERTAAATPPLDAVRGRLVHRLLRERREMRTHERLAALRAR
jgi:hypothetical protein